jgi:transcriptional regulator with XRE-family HTH domain
MTCTSTANPDAIAFGAVIRRHRLARDWSLRKMATRCGLSANYLGVLEKGRNIPSLTTILDIAEVLNVNAGELVAAVARKARGWTPSSPAPEETTEASGSDP